MKFLLVILLSFSSQTWASLPELYGASAGSVATGNLPETESAANNHYAAALLGYSTKTQFSFNTFYIDTAFESINNVVTKNQTNTVNTFERGNPEVNTTPTTMFGIHLSTPLFAPEGPKFNISIFAPFDRLMEADSGDPYQPRYVMYDGRTLRPNFHLSAAQSFVNWSFSLGAMTGFQSNGETYLVTRTTNGNPSVGKIAFNAKPSIGATASVSLKGEQSMSYFAFQQEMKSKLTTNATGETEFASNASFPFEFDVSSLLFYDPMTIRVGHQVKRETRTFHFGLEWQQWDRYEPSTLELKKQGGVINGSENFEKLRPKNIFIPKIGYTQKLSELWTAKLGYFYRPTPLPAHRLKYAGNSIDTDKHVGSLGVARLFKVYDKDINLDLAYQAHFLQNRKITKTSNREDGDPSEPKIGSPGYEVGGMIHVVSLGLTWMY